MVPVSQTVREVLERSLFWREALDEGVANITELARRLQPEVEAKRLDTTSEATIAMALRRVARATRPNFGARFLKQLSDITVRSQVIEFVFPNTKHTPDMLAALSQAAKGERDAFFHFSQGLHESIIVCSADLEDAVRPLLARAHPKRMTGLSVITMRLPEASLPVPGVYYPILKALAASGISFVEVVSVNTELSLVFKDGDVDRAFGILKRVTN